MASIGDLFLRLLADDKGFAADVTKKAGAAGDAAGKTLGQRMGQAARAGLTAAGTAGGALFGIAATKANELTNAMADFQRETGATQEELASAQKSVVTLSRSNLQSFDEIARAQAGLRTDLGLTQEQAEAATQAFLDYGTATGRDATEGVTALDDILDAWNLDSSKSGEIMNKLVKSHQKYGGSISENEKALKNLAPQLTALNLDVDDGISLLNLFAEGGLDASKAQFALNSAIQKLPPGTTFEEFIAHLAGIEDPAERARQAIEVFGARGGAGLANVLRPGMEGLDDFGISAEEAGDAVTEASEAIKNTPINQFRLAISNLLGPLAEAGTAFGPLILAFTQLGGGRLITSATAAIGGFAGMLVGKLGPKIASALGLSFGKAATSKAVAVGAGAVGDMTAKQIAKRLAGTAAANTIAGGLSDGIGGAGKTGKLKGAMSKLGSALGSPFGMALGIAAAAVVAVALANELGKLNAEIDQMGQDIGENLGNQIATGSRDALQQSKAALEKGIKDLWIIEGVLSLDQSVQADLQRQLDAVNAAIAARAVQIPRDVDAAITGGQDDVTDAAEEMVEGIPGAVEDAAEAAGEAAEQTPDAIAAGILTTQGAVEDAMERLREQMEKELTGSKAAWDTIGQLVDDKLAEGLNDNRPGVKAAAQNVLDVGVTELEMFIEDGGRIGDKAMAKLHDAIKNGTPQQQQAAQHIVDLINGKLDDLPPAATTTGKLLTANLKSGITGASGSITSAATVIANAAKRGVTQYNDNAGTWGTNFVRAFAAGMTVSRAIGAIYSAASTVANVIANILKPGSPPKEGPASTLDQWFGGLMEVFVNPEAVRQGRRAVRRASEHVMGGLALPAVGDRTRTATRLGGMAVSTIEQRLASVAPVVKSRDEAASGECCCDGGHGGGGDTTYNLHMEGALPVQTTRDVTTALMEVEHHRRIPKRTAPAQYPLAPGVYREQPTRGR